MSLVFSKNRQKRSRSSAGDSETSFVKSMTSRVSGLFPASITRWFSSPSSSSANGSAPATDATDSSTDDEGQESTVITQPPAKRMRFTTSGSLYNQYTPPETSASHSETTESSHHYNTKQLQTGRSNFLREPDFASASSVSPAEVSNVEVVTSVHNTDLIYQPQNVSATRQTIATKRKSIFDTLVSKEDTLKKPCAQTSTSSSKEVKQQSQPCYKPAYFGSPFYPGRTMYGGAASSTYINQPNITQRKMTYVKPSTKDEDSVNISYSARKIMDLLTEYSSPLSEARRIPVIQRHPNNANYSLASTSQSNSGHTYSYKRQELHVPTMAAVLRLRQRSRLMETTKAARQIIASHSSTIMDYAKSSSSCKIDSVKETDKSTTKLKTRVTRPCRKEPLHEMPEPVQLPTVVLQIDKDNLPKFSISPPAQSQPAVCTSTPLHTSYTPGFQTMFASAAPTHTAAVSYKNSTAQAKTSTTESPPRNSIFKFAAPERVNLDPPPNVETSYAKFEFGSPEKNVDKMEEISKEKNTQPFSFSNKKVDPIDTTPLVAKSSDATDWNCPDCLVKNKMVEKCVCCGAKRPSAVNNIASKPNAGKCTVCRFAASLPDKDKCINCEKASTQGNKSIPLPIPQPADPTKWKCEGCWVSNEEKADKCACCGSRNPKLAAPIAPAKPVEAEKDWKCEDCWITNKGSVEKCAACGGVKSGIKPAAPAADNVVSRSPFGGQRDPKLADIAKAQKAKWECSSCLVRNEPDKLECVCCGMQREGLSKEITAKPFNFPKESNITFKFGIEPKQQESNIAKHTEGGFKLEPTRKLEEPETNNNNMPTFTFTLPTKKGEVDTLKSIQTPKAAFTFGIPKPVAIDATPVLPSSFGAESAKSAVEEKPQEVPKVDFNATPQAPVKAFGSGFFASPAAKSIQDTPPKFSSLLPSSTPLQKRTASSNVESKESSLQQAFSSAGPSGEPAKVPTFSFGASSSAGSAGSGTGIFGASTSVAITSVFSFGTGQQSAPVTTTAAAPTAPLFQPPENASPAVAMFGAIQSGTPAPTPVIVPAATAPAPVPAPAPALASSATPLFSFGSNGPTAPQTEKPKFNFTFGTNNSEASAFGSGFKGAFGSTDNSSNANAFAMPAPTPIAANNEMSTSMGGEHSATPMQNFGNPQENMWGSTGLTTNMFGNNAQTQKPQPFTFGTPNPFNASAPASAAQPAPSLFGNQQPSHNPFGMSTENGAQPGFFGSPAPASQPANIFGNVQQPASMFDATPAPQFGTPAASPAFEAPSAAPTPTFTFGAPQSSAVFGFGAQAQPQQQSGVYNFGAGLAGNAAGGGMAQTIGGSMMGQMGGMMQQPLGGVQFNMGSAGGTGAGAASVRRVRKAVRRNPQR